MFILPVHYNSSAEYDALKERARRKWPDPDAPWTKRYFDDLYPYWLYNDIAGMVELRVEGNALSYTIFACRGHTPPRRWRHDRRLKGRYTWYDQGHWSFQRCRTREDHLRVVEKCLSVVRKTIPGKFYFDWDAWRPTFRGIDWKRMRANTSR